jgi:hypothetical protein
LLHNDLIIVRNHEDDEKDEWDIMRVMDRQGDVDIKVKIQSNSEFQSLTSSPTQSLGSPRLQINVQDAYEIRFGCSTYAQKEGEKKVSSGTIPRSNKNQIQPKLPKQFQYPESNSYMSYPH